MIRNTQSKPAIFVDADSCPVKNEIARASKLFSVEAVFVASYDHVKNDSSDTAWIYVDTGKEAVDLFIMNHVRCGDIVVTQDLGLASTLLPKRVYVLSPKGVLFEEKDMETALDIRFISAKARRQGMHTKGPKPYSHQDRQRFVNRLTEILSNFEGI